MQKLTPKSSLKVSVKSMAGDTSQLQMQKPCFFNSLFLQLCAYNSSQNLSIEQGSKHRFHVQALQRNEQ